MLAMARGSDTAVRLTYALRASAPKDVRQHALTEIGSAFLRFGGDVSAAAKLLGIGRSTLNRWIAEYPYVAKQLKGARRDGQQAKELLDE
jgi:transcriptional regulator of acetoin/glycerol metabolism